MTSGLLYSPLQPLLHPSGGPPPSVPAPLTVIAGAPGAGKTSVVNELVGTVAPVSPGADRAWLVLRYGERHSANAFVPGRREPRPAQPPGTGQCRPPRRVEVRHPASLLRAVTLVDSPGIGERDAATADLVLDIAERGLGLVFVVEAAAPLDRVQLSMLAAAAGRLPNVAFVLTKTEAYQDWPATLAANRALLHSYGPQLANAPWFVATPVAIAELRRLLLDWALVAQAAGAPASDPRTGIAATADDRWRAILDREVRHRRASAAQRAAIDLATAHVRGVQELGSGRGCPELPYVLDRELHALSVRATRQLAADTDAIVRQVFGAVLDGPPAPAVLARIRAAAAGTVDSLHADAGPGWRERALLLTATAGVAVVTGPGTLSSVSATGMVEPVETVLAPIEVALTAPCYLMWQKRPAPDRPDPDKQDCRRWLQQALRVVEAEIDRELAERFADLHHALAIIAAEAVDHGVLLA